MGKWAERIDTEMQNAVYDYILKNQKNEPAKMHNLRVNQLEEFKKRHLSKCKSAERKTKEVTYDMLSELMQIADIDLKTVYSLVGIDIEWPNEDAAEMCDLCDNLPEDIRKKVKETAKEVAPSFWWDNEEIINAQPTRRAISLFERKFYRSERRDNEAVTPELLKVWADQKFSTSLRTIDFPAISKNLEAPLHWLLRLDDNIKSLAEHSDTEQIMTSYLFMSPNIRASFKKAVSLLS